MGFNVWISDDAVPVVILTLSTGGDEIVYTFGTLDEAVDEAKAWMTAGSSGAENN